MKDPLVSVGIPFYNCESCLFNSVRSIFAQTYTNWELILVDDGSTDSSLKIAQSIDDPRVRVLPFDGKNLQLGARLNQIARAARGEYLARMDADDLCHPLRFEKQVQFMLDHPEVDIVGTASCILDQQQLPAKKCPVAPTHDGIFQRKFRNGISVVHPSLFAKTEWWRVWPYTEHNIRCEDYELWLRSDSSSKFANLTDLFYFTNEYISFALTKYVKSKITAAKIVWQYASKELGTAWALYYVIKRLFHIAVYSCLHVVGLSTLIVKRRYTPLSSEEIQKVTDAIHIVKNTHVHIVNPPE